MTKQQQMSLGIELGSTRVKAVLLDERLETVATGGFEWRSRLEDGHWTYSLDDVWHAVQRAVAALREDYRGRLQEELTGVGAIGVSAMMHGYLAFDEEGELLTPFRTWQDTTTGAAARELSSLFRCNIPLRWSIAHLHQAILDDEPHVARLASLTTLAGYVHWRLTGERVLGIGDASGMFPIDHQARTYDAALLDAYADLVADRGFAWDIRKVLPEIRVAGEGAGRLTPEGALLLDPTGTFAPGAVAAPPEGDAGTGMVATNSVRRRTANVSAGTSIFAMVVLERPLETTNPNLDMVTTPDGSPVVMVHCNNGAADLDDWVRLFGEAARALGAEFDTDALFRTLYEAALQGSPDAGGLVAYNYRAGEPITGVDEGRPLFMRLPESRLGLADFMRAHLYGAFASLRLGFEILRDEQVSVDEMFAHGGVFRTEGVAQRFLAAALDVPVTVSSSASEGGAWGMALLAAFVLQGGGELPEWLETRVFADTERVTCTASQEELEGFDRFMARYSDGLAAERAAVASFGR